MAKVEVTRIGSLTFIGATDNGETGYGATVISEMTGPASLWGSADDFRAAAKFFTVLAEQQEEAEQKMSASYKSCCSCDSPSCGKSDRNW